MKNTIKLLCVAVVVFGWCNRGYAFERCTHKALTEKAVGPGNSAAELHDYLKYQLGLSKGLETELTWTFPKDIKVRLKQGKANPNKTTGSILNRIKAGSTIEHRDCNPGEWGNILLPFGNLPAGEYRLCSCHNHRYHCDRYECDCLLYGTVPGGVQGTCARASRLCGC